MRQFWKNEDGVSTITMLFFVVSLLMITGTALDYMSAVRTQSRLQALADASALSAAMRLPRTDLAMDAALNLAERNGNLLAEGEMLRREDIEFGRWSTIDRSFQPGHSRPNAVRLIARRDVSAGNSLPTLLMRLVGVDQLDLTATSLAARVVRLCSGTGFFSAQTVTTSNSNHYYNGFCLHGELGVTTNNNHIFELGSTISMVDLATFREGLNNIGSQEALLAYSHIFTIPDQVQPTIVSMRAGDFSSLPSYITNGPVFVNSINQSTNLVPGTLYVVSGDVNLGSNRTLRDVAIVAGGNISVGSNTLTNRLVLAAEGSISFNTNNWIGSEEPDVCSGGIYTTYLLAMGSISMNSNSTIRGVLMGSRQTISLGNNNGSVDGVTAEALGPISYGNANRSSACDNLNTEMDEISPAGIGGSNLVF